EENNLYIGVNESLDFMVGPEGKKIRMKFALDRTKINFVAYFVREENGIVVGRKFNFGGELIDCSIIHKDTSSLPHFFEKLKFAIRDYVMTGPNGKELKFKGYSLRYLAEDLDLILFKTVTKPWEDVKYAKRIKRLFFMYLMD